MILKCNMKCLAKGGRAYLQILDGVVAYDRCKRDTEKANFQQQRSSAAGSRSGQVETQVYPTSVCE